MAFRLDARNLDHAIEMAVRQARSCLESGESFGSLFLKKENGRLLAKIEKPDVKIAKWILTVSESDAELVKYVYLQFEKKGGKTMLVAECPCEGYPEIIGRDDNLLPGWRWLDELINAAETLSEKLKELK